MDYAEHNIASGGPIGMSGIKERQPGGNHNMVGLPLEFLKGGGSKQLHKGGWQNPLAPPPP